MDPYEIRGGGFFPGRGRGSQGRGRGIQGSSYGRDNDRGARSMDSLFLGDGSGQRQNLNRGGWRQKTSDGDGRSQNFGDWGERRLNFGDRDGWRQNFGDWGERRQKTSDGDGRSQNFGDWGERRQKTSDGDGRSQNFGDWGERRQKTSDGDGRSQNFGDWGERRQNFGDRGGWRQNFGDWGERRQKTSDGDGRSQNFGDWGERRQKTSDGDGRSQNFGDRGGWRQNFGGRGGRRPYAPRGGFSGNSSNPDGPVGEGEEQNPRTKRQRKYPISMKDLDKLTTLKADVVALELLNERSGFSILVESDNIHPDKFGLVIKVLALATTSQALMETVYELLNKTCSEAFVIKLMNYSLTLKRQFPERGPVFFADLYTVLETFCNGMISVAVTRLVNLVDSCHGTLTTMHVEGYVEDYIVKKYKALLDRLNEAVKKWEEERKMSKQDLRKRREAQLDNMEPPDDFREIPVLPTPMDIIETKRPFLRRNVVQGNYNDGEHYLDVQFRLLREDFVRPLREGINQFRSNVNSRITNVRIYRNVTYVGSRLEGQRIFHEVQLQLQKTMKLENSKRLMYGNLVCFSNDNFATMILGSVADRSSVNLKYGIIGIEFESDISEYDMSGSFVMVESRAYFMAYKHVLQALKEMPNNIPMELYVVKVQDLIDPPKYLDMENGVVYDLRVITKNNLMKKSEALSQFFMHKEDEEEEEMGIEARCLQKEEMEIEARCLQEEEMEIEARRLQNVLINHGLAAWPSSDLLGLDSSQHKALHSALNRELAIIQGPPGTGKTFIGLKIVQTLLHNSQVWKDEENPTPILVVCFTNHALDQFLEGMMTFTNSIVRVGSRTKNASIEKYQINRLVQSVVQSRSMPHSIHSQKVDISSELRRLEEGIAMCRQIECECEAPRGIFSLDVFSSNNIIPDHILRQIQEIKDKRKITHWLTRSYHPQSAKSHGQQASTLTARKQKASAQQANVTLENDIDEDKRKDTEVLYELEERDRMIDDDIELHVNTTLNYVSFEVEIEYLKQELYDISQLQVEDETSYLTYIISKGLLDALHYGLSIPADRQEMEVMEAQPGLNIWHLEPQRRWQLYNHWVAQLQRKVRPRCKFLSIEFQKQVKSLEGMKNAQYLFAMRKAAVVGMTTTGAAQYNKILRDLAPAIVVIEEAAEILESHVITSLTAACQHLIMIGDHQQLQPSATVYELATKYGLETSLFERLIKNGLAYETLEYQHRMRPSISSLLVPSIYPTLKDHPSVNDYPRVLGLTHNIFFIAHQQLERKESDDNNSHENQHEAELMIGLCRHLMLQGYEPDDITILTAYSGQFFLLRKLQRENPICTGVRICVVDNFQGEENKIILLSLVRSNPEGKVGFLRTENRVCVALSRAKHGLYITGNMEVLSQSSDLWKKIKADLCKSGSLGESLPLRCENHPDQLSMVSTGKDFLAKSPEGGCLQVCEKPLPNCRHSCPKVCHLDDPDHLVYECQVPCPKILCSLDHKCPKLCWEECGPCMVILTKYLPCDHSHKIPCHVSPKTYKCPTLVEKLIPACQHVTKMPCHQDPAMFTCPYDCDTRVECGHKCRKKCHRTRDPHHEDYACKEQCTKINVGCSQNHPCLKKCYQECGSCVVKVNKKLPCRHEAEDVECSQPVEEIECRKKCTKTLPCGHPCKKLCFKECGNCEVLVKKEVPSCKHIINVECSKPARTSKCSGSCPKMLPCGHPCREKCNEACTAKCPELVVTNNQCPKKHLIKLPCHLRNKVQGEAAWEYCSDRCDKTLDCGHPCVGKCGECLHGRLHQACRQQCDRALVCGHTCKYPCGNSCPPCQEECRWKCVHNKCRQKCGIPCVPCQEKCEWRCEHSRCGKKCGEKCSRKPCDQPCPKKLKCGHECVGLCGDPCPPLCRECDLQELTEFMLLGNEDEPDARFVLLEDCGHCIEVEGLEAWLKREGGEVGMKACPKCRNAIYNNRRYQAIVLEAYKAVQDIKNKYYKTNGPIKIRDIEFILQDPQVIHTFQPQVLKVTKKIFPRKKGKSFHNMSADEKTLCHFQAQVLKKATSILNPSLDSTVTPASNQWDVLKSKVAGLVSQVTEKTTTISDQMKEELTCELQRLSILPSYWTFLEKFTTNRNYDMMKLNGDLKDLMDPTLKFDQERDNKVRAKLMESEQYIGGLGISDNERLMILAAMNLRNGHWYKCPKGHVYCITECGGAMEEGTCPECKSKIGGGSHRLRSDNAVATEMDGARHAAWSEQNNMGNFDLGN